MKAVRIPHLKKSIILILIVSSNITLSVGKNPPPQSITVEIVNIEKVPIVKCELNGKEVYLVLDSGSEITLVHGPDAEKYGFTYKNGASKSIVGASGGHQSLFEAQAVELTIGQQLLKTQFYATDLSVIVKFLAISTGLKISGIVGMDLMCRYGFEIDYLSQQLVLHPNN